MREQILPATNRFHWGDRPWRSLPGLVEPHCLPRVICVLVSFLYNLNSPPAWRPLAFKADVRGVHGLRKAAEDPAWPLLTSGCRPGISHTVPRVPESWGTAPLLQLPRSFGGGRGEQKKQARHKATQRKPDRHVQYSTSSSETLQEDHPAQSPQAGRVRVSLIRGRHCVSSNPSEPPSKKQRSNAGRKAEPGCPAGPGALLVGVRHGQL